MSAYTKAVESGDLVKAQELLDQAAKEAGFSVKIPGRAEVPLVVYHGSRSASLEGNAFMAKFGTYFTTDLSYAEGFCEVAKDFGESDPKMYRAYVKVTNPEVFDGEDPKQFTAFTDVREPSVDVAARGFDGQVMLFKDGSFDVRVNEAWQIKSAESIERDDKGEVIPLNKRFTKEPDIRGLAGRTSRGHAALPRDNTRISV